MRAKFQMWQQRILKYAAASKDKAIVGIMEEMGAALGEDGCDSEGKYEVFHQLRRITIHNILT